MDEPSKPQEEKTMQSTSVAPRLSAPRPRTERTTIASVKTDPTEGQQTKISIQSLSFFYGRVLALKNISLVIPPNKVTAFIGPSGCGKSTLIRTLNRMNDVIPGTRVEGRVDLDGENIYAPGIDIVALRRRVGMVFQKPNPFPRSIFENVAYGVTINRMTRS